jgi:hypothetical protein
MRNDVKNLLAEIGQPDFPYRDFNGKPGSDFDYWPLLERIAGDPIVAQQIRSRSGRLPIAASSGEAASPFARCASPPQDPAQAAERGVDVRSLLRRLSESEL